MADPVLIEGGRDITFDHNTVLQDGWSVVYGGTTRGRTSCFTNNIVPRLQLGDHWSGTRAPATAPSPRTSRARRSPKRISPAPNPANYPTGQLLSFVDAAVWGSSTFPAATIAWQPTSPYRSAATDGTDVGVNIDGLNAATGLKAELRQRQSGGAGLKSYNWTRCFLARASASAVAPHVTNDPFVVARRKPSRISKTLREWCLRRESNPHAG